MKILSALLCALPAPAWVSAAAAEQIPVRHIQLPAHCSMVTRSETGKTLGRVEFSQAVQGDDVTMRLTFRFLDGSIDDETTTFSQKGVFRLLFDRHVERGPFFAHQIDFAVDAKTGVVTDRAPGWNGEARVESRHLNLPADLANGFIGTLLLSVPPDASPFRVRIVAPVEGGRLVQLRISPDSRQRFQMDGKNLEATVFRIHPELGGITGWIASLLGLQPKDVMVWISEGADPAVVRIVGQLGGAGPVVTSDLEGTHFPR
ncbi:MAG: hypothetical protein ACLGQX_13195 [Acidobacteriota bacterium]